MATQHLAHWTPYRLTYRVRGRAGSLHMEQYAARRRAAEIAAFPVLAASWQVPRSDIAITWIEEAAA